MYIKFYFGTNETCVFQMLLGGSMLTHHAKLLYTDHIIWTSSSTTTMSNSLIAAHLEGLRSAPTAPDAQKAADDLAKEVKQQGLQTLVYDTHISNLLLSNPQIAEMKRY